MTTATQRFLQPRENSVLAVAASGVAAQLRDGGRTAHFSLKISIPVTSESTRNIEADSQLCPEL